jgi:hypothetical protein
MDREHLFVSRLSHAITVAGKCAAVFAAASFAFFFAPLLMVRGDGTAPVATHLATAIIDFTGGLIGVSSEEALLPVVVFWSLVVFAAGLLIALPFATPADQAAWPWALGVVVVVMGAASFLIRSHERRDAVVDERALVVEFVRHDAEVMRAVGGSGEADLVGYTQAQNEPATYEVAVYGTKTLYAIVEVAQSSPSPAFRLLCTTPLSWGQRDAAKRPCEQ